MPKISIILPVYNVEKYLSRSMNSLLNQTLEDIEIIMVDDESPDNCPQLCEDYKRRFPNVKVIHKKNGGLGFARNSGLEVAEGKYVAFVDSDDFVDLDMYEHLYDYAEKNQCDAVFCGYYHYVDENHIRKFQEYDEYQLCVGKNDVDGVLMDMVGSAPGYKSDVRILSSMWKGIYSQELIKRNHLQFVSEREYIAEDIIFHIDFIPLCKRIGFIPQCHYYYCDNGTSLTRKYRADRFEKELYQYHGMAERLMKKGYEEERFQQRLDRYLLLKIRSCVSQTVHNTHLMGKSVAKLRLNEIVSSMEVRQIVKSYPYSRLPIKHRVFFLLIKFKLVELLMIMFKR